MSVPFLPQNPIQGVTLRSTESSVSVWSGTSWSLFSLAWVVLRIAGQVFCRPSHGPGWYFPYGQNKLLCFKRNVTESKSLFPSSQGTFCQHDQSLQVWTLTSLAGMGVVRFSILRLPSFSPFPSHAPPASSRKENLLRPLEVVFVGNLPVTFHSFNLPFLINTHHLKVYCIPWVVIHRRIVFLLWLLQPWPLETLSLASCVSVMSPITAPMCLCVVCCVCA